MQSNTMLTAMPIPGERTRTTYLGQYTRETSNAIAAEFEKAGIEWSYKEPGFFSQVWEWGVRMFVDKARLDEARSLAERVSENRT